MFLKNLFNKFLAYLEDPRYPSVGPHLRFLSFLGIWDPSKPPKWRYNRIHFYFVTIYYITIYIKSIFYQATVDTFLTIIKYVPFHVGMFKAIKFKKDHDLWEDLINYMTAIEHNQKEKSNGRCKELLKNYIHHNRIVTYNFWFYVITADFLIFTEPYSKNQKVENGTSIYYHMFDGYTPFADEPPGYYFSMIVETIVGFSVSFYIIAWDALVVSIMIFFSGQLRIAKVTCSNIVENDYGRSVQNIIEFHKFYMKLVRYHKMFNDMISPVMFVYLIFASINLGVVVIQIVMVNGDMLAVVWSLAYAAAILMQLLLFYWHSNDVTVESLEVRYGLFEGNWTTANSKFLKNYLLLGMTTTKRLVFMAGPFTEMSLYAFTAILRGTYSFYTLLKGTN